MEKRTRPVALLSERLGEAIQRSGLSKTAYAARAGVDRTTLSQLLSPSNDRLPRVDTLRNLAAAHDLSLDWLLGLSNSGPIAAELVPYMSFETPGPSDVDEQLLEWFEESAHYKVRYVPATLPDLFKTEELIRFERAGTLAPDASQTIATLAAQLARARHPDIEIECCSSVQSLAAFARGEGRWRRLGVDVRRAQLERMIELTSELYPTVRWFLFDVNRRYAAPVTIFGPSRAALYLGGLYLVLTSAEHVRTLSRHFDGVVRDATVQPTSVPKHLTRLTRHMS